MDFFAVGGTSGAGEQFAGESGLALTSVLENVKATTGIDLAEVIQGRAVGRGIGQSIGEGVSQASVAVDPKGDVDELLSAAASAGADGLRRFSLAQDDGQRYDPLAAAFG